EETYDLVVVGAGISGLAAVYFYRAQHPKARVLILENHDEFGGHARRNEFNVDGRPLIGYGGSEAIQSPAHEWSEEALGLLGQLGVHVEEFEKAFHRDLYPALGLSRGVFFSRQAFGADKLVTGDPMRMVADDIPAERMNARSVEAFVADYPIDAAQKAKIVALFTEKRDVLAGKTTEQKEELLAKTSYRDFIKNYWGLDDTAANTFQGRSNDFFAIGIDGVPAYDAFETGYPGFQGLGLEHSEESAAEMDDPYIYHFPDGNASIARLLVRRLIPGVAPGNSMHDIVTARFDYDRLDAANSPVRLRLNSTVVSLRNREYGKAPLVYVNVAVRNWFPWVNRGVHEITNPMGFFSRVKLDYPVSLGDYQFPTKPDQPMLLHLVHVPTLPPGAGVDQRTAWRGARNLLYSMTFDDFEQRIRGELNRMLRPGGFDVDHDIRAITVNRWGHGYAYGFNSMFDEEHDPEINVIAQKRIGRIGIAGSDAA